MKWRRERMGGLVRENVPKVESEGGGHGCFSAGWGKNEEGTWDRQQ